MVANMDDPAPPHFVETIGAVYRELLGRSPDERGLVSYQNTMRDHGFRNGLALMLRGILRSDEYRNRVYRKEAFWKNVFHEDAPIGSQAHKIHHIVSLGTHCLTAAILKKYGLKPHSLPFDWLFSSPQAVLHCLEDDFQTLLERKHYVSVTDRRQDKSAGADHLFYRSEFGIGDMFAHRDPTEDQDYAYILRTVQRFRVVMASDEAKLFLMVVGAKLQTGDYFQRLSHKLSHATKNGIFICVQLLPPAATANCVSLKRLAVEGADILYEFQPSSTENGVSFKDIIDEMIILRLIRGFSIDLRPVQVLMSAT